MEGLIRKAIQKTLSALGAEDVLFSVEWPGDLAHGDFATNAALVGAKLLGKNPKTLAEELAPLIRKELGEKIESVSVAGPGFINITLARRNFSNVLLEARTKEWGEGTELSGKRVMVEYTDPNPFKEMHIGHLMSNVIGEAIARGIANAGATVARACYQGDVGPHVAKALWGLQEAKLSEPATAEEIGKAYAHGSRAYEESPKAKEEIDTINRALYARSDETLMELWRKGRNVSLSAFEDMYKVLGTKFDYYFFESETAGPGMELAREAEKKGILRSSEGAVIFPGEERGLHTLVFITSQGTPTYEAKELGLAFLKEERWPSDHSFILTAAEQVGHFKVALAALHDIAPMLAEKTSHIPHGFLRLTAGKMSSREGNIITAASLIDDMTKAAEAKNSDPLVAQQIALGAIKYMILRQAPGGDIIFDPEKSLSLEGESGPYLQYSYVRAKTVLEKASKKGSETDAPGEPFVLERLIRRFPEVLARTERERAPHHIAQYLTQLSSEWNSFYAQERIIDGEHESYKLLLAEAFANTMKNGLTVLGIPIPEKM